MIRALADGVLAVLLAPLCVACERPLDEPTRGPVCGTCWRSIRPFTPPLCRHCGDPLPSWRVISVEASTCARCRRLRSAVSCSRAVGAHCDLLSAVVHALKYDGRRSLARPLGALMRRECQSVLAGADLVVPVPLH